MIFLEGSGVFVEFFSARELWCERTGALVKFENFLWIFGGF
jgi:hypothetical protein